MTIILDPTDERDPLLRTLTPRDPVPIGIVALLDISKPRGDILIDRIEARLNERAPELSVRRYRKPTFTQPAPQDLRRKIARECDYVIEALAD